jgi:hypothetical protein
MKKICLTVIGLYIGLFGSIAQNTKDSVYESKKLKLSEIDFVSSYYHQEGNNSSVTGGIGTEKLTDIANVLDLNIIGSDWKGRKHTLILEAGVDTYTSASSDKVDLKANSSASSSDIRFYPSISWNMDNENKGRAVGFHASYSKEFDYQSFGLGGNVTLRSKNNNRELDLKAQAYIDQVSLVYPKELIPSSTSSASEDRRYPISGRNTFSGSFSLSQVVTKNLQVMVLADFVKQEGYLSLPFHRVYFTNNKVAVEKLPAARTKVPIGLRANYFFGDKLILRSFYRFYKDDWGVLSHTIDMETVVKINPFLSVTPFYRYYTQTAATYFDAYKKHLQSDTYYTSNYDLSKFNSAFFGAGIRMAPVNGILNLKHFNMLELRYGHYSRTNGLNSNIVSLHLKWK